MNTQAIIDRLLASDGIIAVLLHGEFKTKQENPDSQIRKLVLEHAHSIAGTAGEDIRVVVGIYTITVSYDPEATVVVALPTGHNVAKSLRRMIRRATKSTRTGTPRPRRGPSQDKMDRISADTERELQKNEELAVGGVRSW